MENKLSRENGLCVLVQNKGLLVLPNCMAPSLWDGVAKSPLEAANHVVKLNTITEHGFQLDNVDLVTSRVLEDIQCMDLQDVVGETPNSLKLTKGKSSWEASVDN
ncbi:hypothetical protein V6N13_133768 [Hibiscus sabdariffa]